MNNLFGRRAVVIGAGIGGLSVAGVLARHFEQVVVLERDRLAGNFGSRPGTPQDRHPHGLLAGGLRALDEIFPGFKNDLAEAGAVPVRLAQDIRYERADVGLLPMRDLDLSILCASRPLIECVLRRKVSASANIALRPQCRVTAILSREEVTCGVEFDTGLRPRETLDAELVVDASGRGRSMLNLLDELGWKRPAVTQVEVDISYSTAVVKIPHRAVLDSKVVLTLPNPPILALNAVLVSAEGGSWMTAIAGPAGTARPDTWNTFLDTLRRLTTPTIFEALRHADAPEGIRHFGFPASLWRHFEQMPRLPRGALPIGDAFCRFNPIYGQGMSAAAQQARLLQDVMHRAAAESDPLGAAQAGFMAGVESVLRTPWEMSTSADLAFPETRGERPDNFAKAQQFESALFRAVVADPVVHRAMMEVGQLLQPGSLLHETHIKERIEAVSTKAFA